MITSLSIINYALIEEVQIDFESGFTIITGETGAGKSIVLGALSLLLGKRADLSVINDATKKCVVEGEFFIENYKLQPFFTKNNLDYEKHTIIRRELLVSGKSRAFINDTPVSLQQMQQLAPYLMDIHNQHDTFSLFSETYQLKVLDALANNTTLQQEYQDNYTAYENTLETLSELKYKKETLAKELDYNTFLLNELNEINLTKINEVKLEEQYETLSNAQLILETLSKANAIFSEEQIGTLETLKHAKNSLQNVASFSSELNKIWERLQSVFLELEDINNDLETLTENTQENPEQLNYINSLLDNIHKLKQKHGVNTLDGLKTIKETLSLKIDNTNTIEQAITQYEIKAEKLKLALTKTAKNIHAKRVDVLPKLKMQLEDILSKLGLQNAKFNFEIIKVHTFKKNGLDDLNILFTANKGLPFGSLKKVASGGELSRIMLSFKAVLAGFKKMPTLIFDEIDTGISGEVANKMGDILKQMSISMQLICITHLPQIAGKGNTHIKIYKNEKENKTYTLLRKLNSQERIDEIAEMIGGKNITKAAITHAKQLLN